MDDNKYIHQIKERLKELNPHLIVLFGSYAYGRPDNSSDIDLLVVTNDDFLPKNFSEHSKLYLKYSRALRPIKEKIAVDLIVQTIPMYKKFIELDSSFANEITSKGIIVYEGNNKTMA